jgi:hypothetical protein
MRRTTRYQVAWPDESGAALIMALIFITIGALVVVALTNLTGTNLLNTSALQAQRNAQTTADAATDAAVQAVRYNGTCESFPPSGSLAMNGYNVIVTCAGTPIAGGTISGSTLSPPSGASFIPEDVGLQVYDQYLPNSGYAMVSSYNSNGTLTLAQSATQTDSSAILGNPLQRLDLFSACVSTSAISACTSSNAVLSAVVQYYDTDSSGNPTNGAYNMAVDRWDVNSANS